MSEDPINKPINRPGLQHLYPKHLVILLPVLLIASALTILLYSSALADPPTTIIIDGINDFEADESYGAADSGATWYFTSDDTHFYYGIDAMDVGGGSPSILVGLYFDTNPQANPLTGTGSSDGVNFNTQKPVLSFNADFYYVWNAGSSTASMFEWDSGIVDWITIGASGVTSARTGTYIEFAVPRSNLGTPSALNVEGAMINEAEGNEMTFFMVPYSNPTGSYDPDFTTHLSFELAAPVEPIPTISEWGMIIMALLLITVGFFVIRRRQEH